MFHTTPFESSAFHDWRQASDHLYLQKYLELGGKSQDYQPLRVDNQYGDQYLMYVDDEAGICGSAVITAVPYSFDINDVLIAAGTCALRNVLFHIRAGHPVHDQPNRFRRITRMFHFCLFEQLWHRAKRASHKIALSLQTDLEAHEDLKDFGGFTFDSEVVLEEGDCTLSMGVIALTKETWNTYQLRKEENFNPDGVERHTFTPLPPQTQQTEVRP